MRCFIKQKNVLLTIFILAVVLRLGLPLLREKALSNQHFSLAGDHFYHHSISDSIYYNYTAKAILEGKGYSINYNEIIEQNIDVGNLSVPNPNNKLLIEKWKIYKPNKIRLIPATDFGQWHVDAQNYFTHRIIPPLYPLFLAICYWLFGANTFAYFLPQALIGALTCVLIYLIAEKIFDYKIAALAGFAVALYPDLIFWTYMVRPETLYIFLLALSFILLIKGAAQKTGYLIYLGMLIFGLACLTRIVAVLFVPVILLWMYSALGYKRKTLTWISVSFIILIIVLLPWCFRNYLTFRQFSFFTVEQGAILLDYTYNFSLNEFKDKASSHKLWRLIATDGHNVADPSSNKPIEQLNRLLDTPQYYDIWNSKNKAITVSNEIQGLIYETKNIRNKKFAVLSANEQDKIKHLNRLLLEITYPQLCPKGLYFTGSDDLISSKSSIENLMKIIIKHPKEYSLMAFKRLIKFLGPVTPQMDAYAKIYRTITWLIVFPLAFGGMIIAVINKNRYSVLLIAFIIFNVLLYPFTYVDDGLVYRYPIQPFMCVFFAEAVLLARSAFGVKR